jgi:citrate lyase subunit beta/citryl-CoA lyase
MSVDRAPARPIRTALLVGATSDAEVEAAVRSEADALYLDLEAAVPLPDLADARRRVARVVGDVGVSGRPVVVRVNAARTGEQVRDLAAVVRPGLYGVMLPKIADPDDVRALAARLDHAEAVAGLAGGTTVIHPVIETAPALRLAYEIASASPRVAHMGGVAAPGGDLARALGFRWTPGGEETAYVRAKLLVDARTAGVPFPLSGLAPGEDVDEAAAIARSARRLGYEGLLIAHAHHAPAVNEVFTPTAREAQRWQALVDAGAAGSVSYRGRRLDPDTVAWAAARLELVARFGTVELGSLAPRGEREGYAR